MGEKWCILRTAGRHTLSLAASLSRDGYDVWTPVETRIVRVPRVNVKREVRLPIMPSYIFARAGHLVDLLQLAAMPVKPRRGAGLREPAHEGFSVLRWRDRIPFVADQELVGLRRIEDRRTPIKRAEYAFPRNADVRVNSGAFQGMVGVVENSDRGVTIVCFAGRRAVKIPTSLLSDDEAYRLQPETETAALAA